MFRANRQGLPANKSRIERALESRRRSGLALEAGREEVRGAGAQQAAVDLVALAVHRRGGLVFDAYFDGSRPLDHHPSLRGAVTPQTRVSFTASLRCGYR